MNIEFALPDIARGGEGTDEAFKPDDSQEAMEYQSVVFSEWAVQELGRINKEDSQEELVRNRKWQKNVNYYRGIQRGFWDDKKKVWVEIPLDELDPVEQSILLVDNQFRPQIKALIKELTRSRSRISVRALNDTPEAKSAARFADKLITYYQTKHLDEIFRQRQAKLNCLKGNYLRYVYPSKTAKGVKVPQITKQTKKVVGADVYECKACGAMEELENVPEIKTLPQGKCPKCGEEGFTTFHKGFTGELNALGKTEMIDSGDLVTELVDPSEIKLSLNADRISNSSYLRRRRPIEWKVLQSFFKSIQIPKGKLSEVGRMQQQSKGSTGASDQNKGEREAEAPVVEFEQLWLDMSRYCDIKPARAEKIGALEIQADIPLSEQFPYGLYLEFASNRLLRGRPEDKNKYWDLGGYDITTDTIWSDGVEDAVQNQQILNELRSLSMENILYNASGKTVYNPHLVDPETMSGSPKDAVPMSTRSTRDDDPRKAVYQMQGMSLTQEVGVAMMEAKGNMREQLGSFPSVQGMSDPNVKTATGISIIRDAAIALIGTPLAVMSYVDVSWAGKILRHVKEGWIDGKYERLLGSYSKHEIECFKRIDLDKDIEVYVEPNSWLPKADFEHISDLSNFLMALGLPLGFLNPQLPQKVREYAASIYRMPFDLNEMNPDTRLANISVERLKTYLLETFGDLNKDVSLEDMTQAMEDFNTEIIVPDVECDNHQEYINAYMTALKTDEAYYNKVMAAGLKFQIGMRKEMLIEAGLIELDRKSRVAAKLQEIQNPEPPPMPPSPQEMMMAEAQANSDAALAAPPSPEEEGIPADAPPPEELPFAL